MLRFRVLGPFQVEDDQGPLSLGSARRRALLALLTLNAGRVVAVDRLIDALWGEAPPRTAAHVLHVYVSDLRHVIPDQVLVTAPPGYLLRVPADAVDLDEFERLLARARAAFTAGDPAGAVAAVDAALALWRGPVLDDLASEGFVRVEAQRLEELRLTARELRAAAALMLPDRPDLVPELQTLTVEHPYRERSHALLMRALAACGRQAEALDIYTSIRGRLAAELGIEPGVELRAAQTAVLRQEIAPAGLPTGVVVALGADPLRLSALARAGGMPAAASRRELLLAAVLDADRTPADLTAAAAAAASALRSVPVPARSAAFRSHDLARDVAALVAEHDADLVVLDAAGHVGPRGWMSDWLLRALTGITADVALLIGDSPAPRPPYAILFGGSEHDWAAAELAALLTRATGTVLRVIGTIGQDDDASRLIMRVGFAIQRAIGVQVEPILVEPTRTNLLTALAGTTPIIGLSERWQTQGLGSLRHQLAQSTPGALLSRRGLRPGLLATPTSSTRFAWSVASTSALDQIRIGRPGLDE
ncbi:MAG TPA: AfsR/SARP family transcriptional regulator [Kineosporiaceae bacterium]|nr:AfsR/SARP family transcriptional regulator [Kineosporiaceae bacterium]